MRIGHGYDVHRLVTGRKLILGGVDIPHHLGLLGHSDADVVTHALMDALLGAAALGDIGQHFPDTDLNVDGMSPFEAGEACVYGLKTFGRYLGIPQNLRSLGVDPADFEVMAENAMKDACAATNPRKATKDQIIAIFQKAYDGD